MARKNTLTASNIKYLLAISDLSREGAGVRCVDISKTMSVSKPSVHKMMDTLKRMELIQKGEYSVVYLTEAGQTLAAQYDRQFQALFQMLTALLQTENGVRNIVCTLLADLAPDCLDEICRKLDQRREENSHVSENE